MPTPLELEIRRQILRYLADEIDLDSFEDWFVQASWDDHRAGDPVAEHLVDDVDLLLIECGNGDWTEQQLRDQLRPLAEVYAITFGARQVAQPWATTASPVIQVEMGDQRLRALPLGATFAKKQFEPVAAS